MGGQELKIRGAGGVVRDDCLDDSVLGVALQFGPQGILVRLGADGRAALVAGVAVADLLGGQGQVMVAGLRGDVDAFGTGLTQQGDYLHGGKVDNVQVKVGGQMGQGQDLRYGTCFVR